MGYYSSSVATSGKQMKSFDDALAESDRKKVDMQDFEYTQRKEFENNAKKGAKGVKKWSGISGLVAGVGAVALGAAALPAALLVGGATLAGGMVGKYTGKSGKAIKDMKSQRFYKSDRNDILDGINKQLAYSTASNAAFAGISAGSAAKGGDAIALTQDQTGKAIQDRAVKETVVNQTKTGTFEIAGEGAKKNVQTQLDKDIGKSFNKMVGLPEGDGVRELAQSSESAGFLANGKPNYAMQKKVAKQSKLDSVQNYQNTVSVTPNGGSTQYKNLTTSKWLGGGTASEVGEASLTLDNMGNNLKAAYRGLTGSGGANGSVRGTLDKLQTGKTLLDWYNQDNYEDM